MNVLRNWFRSLSSARRSAVPRLHLPKNRRPWQQLRLEGLETRLVPSCNPFVDQFGELLAACDNAANTFTLDHSGSTTLTTYTGGSRNFNDSTFNTIRLNMGTSANTVNVRATVKLTFVTGRGGLDNVNIGKNGRLNEIAARIDVSNPPVGGYSALDIDNSADPAYNNVAISDSSVSFNGAPITFAGNDLRSLVVRSGSGGSSQTITDTPFSSFPGGLITTVARGADVDAMNVQHTSSRLEIEGNGGLDDVFINANPGAIGGIIEVRNFFGGFTALHVDAAAATDPYTATVGDSISFSYGSFPINYRQEQLRSLTVRGGSGNANGTYNITNTPFSSYPGGVITTVVADGAGHNLFNVLRTRAGTSTSLIGGTGVNQFAFFTDSNALLGPVAVHGRLDSNSFMTYNDSTNAAAQTYTLTANTLSRSGQATVTFDNLNQVILYPATIGGNTINMASVAAGVFANFGAANGDFVTIGANWSLASILGPVDVTPYANTSATAVVDDSADLTPPAPITFSNDVDYAFVINGLAPANIYLGAGQNTTLNTSLRAGAGNKTFNLQAAPRGVALNLDAGSGTNTLDYTGYAGNVLANLQTGVATGFSLISNIQNLTGASGGPDGSYNILVGNGGNVLTGGNGRRNLLIAGNNGIRGSTLIGGDQDDILIGGTTMYDTEAGMVSLQAIMDYWAGSADDSNTRVANLTSGAGVPLLDATKVTGNGLGNTLTGGAGLDLFYGNLALDTHDWDPATETFISV
jgi:hypothetical protein